jgi:hypothetical protein
MPVQEEGSDNPLAKQCVRQLGERRILATQALNKAAQRQSPDTPRWSKGQKVWLNAQSLALPYRTIKLVPRRHGPFIIEEVQLPVVYKLWVPPQWNIHPIFHASLLMPYVETEEHRENYSRPPSDIIEGEEQYEVEAIWAHWYYRHKLQYLIKWKGYLESDNTWEPTDNVQAPWLVKKYHKVHPLEDKKPAEKARTVSTPTSSVQPTWLIKSDLWNTFANIETAAVTLAATARMTATTPAKSPPSIHEPQP